MSGFTIICCARPPFFGPDACPSRRGARMAALIHFWVIHQKYGCTIICCPSPPFCPDPPFLAWRQNSSNDNSVIHQFIIFKFFQVYRIYNCCNNIFIHSNNEIVLATTILALQIASIRMQTICWYPIDWQASGTQFEHNICCDGSIECIVDNFTRIVGRLRGYLRLWQRLLSCVLLELLRFLHLPTFLIAFVLPMAQALLIFFHNAVNSFLPLPSLHPLMPPLFPLVLRLPAFLVDSLDSLRSWMEAS